MDSDQAHNYRSENMRLIVQSLKKLRVLKAKMLEEYKNVPYTCESSNSNEPEATIFKELNFANLKNESFHDGKRPTLEEVIKERNAQTHFSKYNLRSHDPESLNAPSSRMRIATNLVPAQEDGNRSPPRKRHKSDAGESTKKRRDEKDKAVQNGSMKHNPSNASIEEFSSNWSRMHPMVVGASYKLYPLSLAMEQRLILQYLCPLFEYQDVCNLY